MLKELQNYSKLFRGNPKKNFQRDCWAEKFPKYLIDKRTIVSRIYPKDLLIKFLETMSRLSQKKFLKQFPNELEIKLLKNEPE